MPSQFILHKLAFMACVLATSMVLIAGPAEARPPAQPASCAEAVKQAQNSIWLRVQGGSNHATAVRENAKVQLYIAGMAAAAGNEAECWQHFNVASIGY
jgi:hypothetical protein